MNTQDICKFVPSKGLDKDLLALNFVYECEYFPKEFLCRNAYSLNIVCQGKGTLQTRTGNYPLSAGDVFLILPQQEFRVENTENIHFYYITFLGIRANALIERLETHRQNMVYHNLENLIPIWKQALQISNPENLDLLAEGTLLYTLAHLCQTSHESPPAAGSTDIILKIKQYMEEHFFDPNLTLRSVSAHFGYNHKYISQKFNKTISIGFNDYLQNLRIQYAQKLIEDGMQNVTDIAKRCGYHDPFYFSRLYKEKTGQSPKQHIMRK